VLVADAILQILQAVGRALQGVHKLGITHGSVSASNVVLDGNWNALLAGWGSGRQGIAGENKLAGTRSTHAISDKNASTAPSPAFYVIMKTTQQRSVPMFPLQLSFKQFDAPPQINVDDFLKSYTVNTPLKRSASVSKFTLRLQRCSAK